VIERLAYDPWGKRRNTDGLSDTTDSLVGRTTDRGFTEHEHLDETGVVHMNGRIYDPLIGRFMSSDPLIQAPNMLQSYNRYAYVMNNPLNLTDPSGYFSLKSFLRNPFRDLNNHGDRVGGAILGLPFGSRGYRAVFNFLQGSGGYQVKSAVISGLSIFCGYAAAACNGGGQAGLAKAYGASDWDAFNSGGVAALSTAAFQAAGTIGGQSYLAHAAAGCVSAAAGGGNCGQGAVAAVFGKFATNSIGAQPGVFDAYQAAATVVAGGVGSVIAGGKFENGAKTAAYGYLYNQLLGRAALAGAGAGAVVGAGMQSTGDPELDRLREHAGVLSVSRAATPNTPATWYHYTDLAGYEGIMQDQQIKGTLRVVFATNLPMSSQDAESVLFIGAGTHAGRGDYVIQFAANPGVTFFPAPKPGEYVHFGALRFGRHINVIYSGPNRN
jgi:RHS repeat-associated protein